MIPNYYEDQKFVKLMRKFVVKNIKLIGDRFKSNSNKVFAIFVGQNNFRDVKISLLWNDNLRELYFVVEIKQDGVWNNLPMENWSGDEEAEAENAGLS